MARAATLLALTALAGCTSLGSSSSSAREPADETFADQRPINGSVDSLAIYLQTLRSLIEGDAVLQADVFRDVAAAADVAPTTTNRLMLALALATATHPSSDARRAQGLLTDLLATGDALLPEEHTLALIHLKDVEQRLILDAEASRLQQAAATAAAQRNDRSAQQLQTALEENRQLKAALDEARARLDAITNIERSIRERENGPDSQ